MSVLATVPVVCRIAAPRVRVSANGFPPFLPKEVEKIRDQPARELARRIERLPVKLGFSKSLIMSSCVKPLQLKGTEPVVLLHGFDSSCLEWRYTYPLLEDAGFDTWAVDILGWGFSDLDTRPPCDVAAKREHLYQLWRSYIKVPMVLVGPSLGAAVAIDFAANHPEAVMKLVLIDASVYTEGTGNLSKLSRAVAYAGVSLLKSIPLRLYANTLAFHKVSFRLFFDWTNVGRLHCLLPWWEDATVDFMISGGYNVGNQIEEVKQKTLIIWGEDDRIINNTLALRLQEELSDSVLHQIPECGHLPHVEKPELGHNLHFYYDTWFDSQSTQPFFYWLDVGDGREVNLEKCPRSKLQHQFIKYLGPIERESFEVIFECGKLIYKQSEKPVNTTDDSKWIFVLSTTRTLYIGQKKKGTFQHSSFLAGGATTAAGRLVAKEGTLLTIWPYSGHYLPTDENFKEFISFLEENNVNLTTVKRCSIEDDDYRSLKKSESVSETVVSAEAASEVDSAVASLPKESVKPEYDMAEVAAKAFELTKRLSCKWTTGTGPRIGCVRDYPSELQFKALEQVNLSPRVIPSPSMNKCPIPSPRPSPKIRLSPRLAYMGIPSPIVSLTLPTPKRK